MFQFNKTNTLNDKETFLSAKSWIFTIAILWGRILQNWEKRQKTRVIYLELQLTSVFKYSYSCFKLAKLLGIKYTVDDADYF
jgi:ABC-type uncharacterized transport system permease subunit